MSQNTGFKLFLIIALKQDMIVNNETMDFQAMSAMDIVKMIQTNPELRIMINEFLKQKQHFIASDNNGTATNSTSTGDNDNRSALTVSTYFSHLGTETQDSEILE